MKFFVARCEKSITIIAALVHSMCHPLYTTLTDPPRPAQTVPPAPPRSRSYRL